jgi:hypothetical protein
MDRQREIGFLLVDARCCAPIELPDVARGSDLPFR